MWAKFYATPNYLFSYRADYFIEHNVSMSGQINYLSGHLANTLVTYANAFNYVGQTFAGLFYFGMAEFSYESKLLTVLGLLFMGAVIFLYPIKIEISNRSRIGALIVISIVFLGTFTIQLLTWSTVGKLYGVDVQPRYFIPLLALLPFIFGFNNNSAEDEKIDKMIILMSVVLLSSFTLLTVCRFY